MFGTESESISFSLNIVSDNLKLIETGKETFRGQNIRMSPDTKNISLSFLKGELISI